MKTFSVGDRVQVDSFEGFGGPGVVVETRDHEFCKHKVRLDDGSQAPFWTHDFELSPVYDSRPDTMKHIDEVRARLGRVVADLQRRAEVHDASKLVDPEVSAFNEFTPKLAASTYGSPEYEAFRKAMGPALAHHYANNSHHPEFYPDGIKGMSLLDLIEMLCDWKAATLRHHDGDICKSVELNQKRFGYSDELKRIFLNTLAVIEGQPT